MIRSGRYLSLAIGLVAAFAVDLAEAQSPVGTWQSKVPRPAPLDVKPPSAFLDACRRYDWLCRHGAQEPLQMAPIRILELAGKVNQKVNKEIVQVSDAAGYGAIDHWSLPRFGKGDCEDLVLQKYKLMLEAGIDSRNFSIAIVLDDRSQNHAVLVLHHNSADLVLDSLNSHILPWNETGYRFLAMQSREHKREWHVMVHEPRESRFLAQR